MKTVVCIKQVPDTAEVKIDPDTNTLIREGIDSVFNPLDTFALEEAVRIREAAGGEVTAISMGPPQAEEALREAMALGADRAVLVSGKELAGADTLATSYTLACAIRNDGGADVILCGKQAIDGDTAQVGPGIAAHLGIPQLTYVRRIREIDAAHVVAECMTDTGVDVVKAPLPVVMTVVKELNEPRLPSLASWKTARSADLPSLSGADIGADTERIGLDGSPTRVKSMFWPDRTKETRFLSADPAAAAAELAAELKKRLGDSDA
jgi:electron transfer flavoprotein beta subunit